MSKQPKPTTFHGRKHSRIAAAIGIGLHITLYSALAIAVAASNLISRSPTRADAGTFDVKSFLALSAPNTAHEDTPHGVPSYYDWFSQSKMYSLNAPRAETTHINFWGEVYANQGNAHPANTRVALRNCQFWVLFSGSSWQQVQASDLGGGAWSEDYTNYITTIDMRSETDGGQSVISRPNQNAHFWASTGFYDVAGRTVLGAFSTCQTRLVLADPNGNDDRASSGYILSMGADWRKPDGSCPFIYGAYICDGMGHGKYIKPTTTWRTAVFSSMTNSDLNTLPMPASSIFAQPDGTYPDTTPEIVSFSASPSTISAGSSTQLSWSIQGATVVSIDNGVGSVSGSTKSVSPTQTKTYTITASNGTGSTTATTMVTVTSGDTANSSESSRANPDATTPITSTAPARDNQPASSSPTTQNVTDSDDTANAGTEKQSDSDNLMSEKRGDAPASTQKKAAIAAATFSILSIPPLSIAFFWLLNHRSKYLHH